MAVRGQQPARSLPIPIVDCGALWCSCDYAMPECAVPERCPGCGSATSELTEAAEKNARVYAFVAVMPLDWGLPALGEGSLEWWQRMADEYEASLCGDG